MPHDIDDQLPYPYSAQGLSGIGVVQQEEALRMHLCASSNDGGNRGCAELCRRRSSALCTRRISSAMKVMRAFALECSSPGR